MKKFFMKENGKFRFGRLLLIILLAAVVILGITAFRILRHPESFLRQNGSDVNSFDTGRSATASLFGEKESTGPAAKPAPEPKDNIVNILLLGVDAYPSGGTSSGTMPHSDVVMLCAVNFDKNTVDLISIPRDSFTKVPGHRGIYRLNSVFNLGGGTDDPRGGYELMCDLAEAWLGGIEVSYYYALDFKAVVDIVDAIGGISYDAETCTWDGPNAVHYDGDAVLHYLRYRQHNEDGDRDRTGRQRAMLTAIFLQLKDASLLDSVPALIHAMGNRIETNTTLAQTAALVSFGASADDLVINSRILDGKRLYRYDWTFSFSDPDLREQIISEVYGIESEPMRWASPLYEDFLHLAGFRGMKYLNQADRVFGYVNMNFKKESIGEEEKALYLEAYGAYQDLLDAYGDAEDFYLERFRDETIGSEETARRDELFAALTESEDAFKEKLLPLADAFSYPEELRWAVYGTWCYDPDVNEVAIDFN